MNFGQAGITIDTDVLAAAMLNVLNREGYIHNAAYLAARDKLREDSFYVNDEQIQQRTDCGDV